MRDAALEMKNQVRSYAENANMVKARVDKMQLTPEYAHVYGSVENLLATVQSDMEAANRAANRPPPSDLDLQRAVLSLKQTGPLGTPVLFEKP